MGIEQREGYLVVRCAVDTESERKYLEVTIIVACSTVSSHKVMLL